MDNTVHLIVGLGNPGHSYKLTRHNAGFDVVQAFADKYGLHFKLVSAFVAELAQGMINQAKVLILRPHTFMNESGIAVAKCVNYYKVPFEQMIVVSDDVALPLGALRLRKAGSCGGHNGLKSIEMHLQTQQYPRLRIGIGEPQHGQLKEYVLDTFKAEERHAIDESVKHAVKVLELWLERGIQEAIHTANAYAPIN